MRKITSLAIVVAAVFAAANAVAGEATDKVTGEFMRGNCWDCSPGSIGDAIWAAPASCIAGCGRCGCRFTAHHDD